MRRMTSMVGALALAALVAGCEDDPGPGRADGRTAPAMPALCGPLEGRITGRVAAPGATELSGLVASRTRRGLLWAHNDSGDGPRLLALSTTGAPRGELAVAGAEHVDWEDMAARRGTLYVGDIGDNAEQRPEIVIYRVPEPEGGGAGSTAPARRIALRYEDGPADAEALLVDPAGGDLVVVTKSLAGLSEIHVAPPAGGTLRRAGRLDLGLGQAVTAGDVSADGRTIALRTYDRVLVWARGPGESVADALRREPCSPDPGLADEGQGETLALSRDGGAAFTVPEGERPPLRRYEPD